MAKVYFIAFMLTGCSSLIEDQVESDGGRDAVPSSSDSSSDSWGSGGPDNNWTDSDSGSDSVDIPATSSEAVETETEVSSDTSQETVSEETETQSSPTDQETESETVDSETVDTSTEVDLSAPCEIGEFYCEKPMEMLYFCNEWGMWQGKDSCELCDNTGFCGCDVNRMECGYVCNEQGEKIIRETPYCPEGFTCNKKPGDYGDIYCE